MQSILVTGATGYVGARLTGWLLGHGHQIRCYVPDPHRIQSRAWQDRVEVVEGDLSDYAALEKAVQGIDVIYYLIPNWSTEGRGESIHAKSARKLGALAAQAGVTRIIMLSVHRTKPGFSKVARKLSESGVPVIEFQTNLIIGSGSVIHEMIRYSCERSFIIFLPPWAARQIQTISVRNALQYLTRALDLETDRSIFFEIADGERQTVKNLFTSYAHIRGLRRLTVWLPSEKLFVLWLAISTPIALPVLKKQMRKLKNDRPSMTEPASRAFNVQLIPYRKSLRLASHRFESDRVTSSWTDAAPATGFIRRKSSQLKYSEGLIVERLSRETTASPEAIFKVLTGIGGDAGWLYANALWKIRGILDVFLGGVGMRSTRRSISSLRVGDTLDFWRVEAVEPGLLLRLRAEMKVPGKAWLEFQIAPANNGTFQVTQTAYFEPLGIRGYSYWYAMYVPHLFIFPGLLRNLIQKAENVD